MLDNTTLFDENSLVNGDIFSWYNVSWIPHEQGWYLALALAYKAGGCIGVVWLSSVIGFITVSICIYVARIKQKSSVASTVIVLLFSNALLGLPGISYRPDTVSLLLLSIELFTLFYYDNKIIKGVCLVLCSLLTAWFHGGIISIVLLVLVVYICTSFIYDRNLKSLSINLVIMLLTFCASLYTNVGFNIWTYNSKQSMYPELRKYQGEWQAGTFEVLLIMFLLCILIGLLSTKVTSMDKNQLLVLSYFCMFIVGYCIYIRIGRQLNIVLLMFAPKALDNFITIIKVVLSKAENNTVVLSKVENAKELIKKIIVIALVPVIIIGNVSKIKSVSSKDINEALYIYGYDLDCVDFIKEKKYERLYVPMNYSTMFIWNDIKTATDMRWDPFLKSVSGIDYMHNKFLINNPIHLKMYVDEFNPDSLLFAYKVTDGITISGEQYEKTNEIECLIDELDSKYADEYLKVYDNISVSHSKSIDSNGNTIYTEGTNRFRWVLYEPIK